jgi:hypothetical protein
MKANHIDCALFTVLVISLSGCQKPDAVNELEKVATALEKAEPAPAPATPDPGTPREPSGPPPGKQVQQAIADYKAGKMEDAVTRLQILRRMSAISPQQRMALQDSIAAVMTEIYTLAEKGDPRAIAAVQRYQQLQNAR